MSSSLKKAIRKSCPAPLKRSILASFYAARVIRARTEMLLFPRKMAGFCPCCGMRFKAFVAGKYWKYPTMYNPSRYAHTMQEVICPVCGSLPRHRILALWYENNKDHLHTSDILFFAPGRCEQAWMKRKSISCTTADLYRRDMDLKLDIQKTGFPDESFDIIICNHVLEHVDDFRMALKEMHRILRTGGSFICSFPMDPKVELLDEDPAVQTDEERLRRFGQNDHVRVFGMKAGQFLTEAHFSVERIDGRDYPEEILPIVGPADYDINLLFHCSKR